MQRNSKLMLVAPINDNTKGSVGFGTNTLHEVFMHAVEMQPYNGDGNLMEEGEKTRVFD